MTLVQTKFIPVQNGFQFVNRFEIHLPIKYTLPFGGAIDLNDVVFGLCGGMAFAALDHFYSGQPMPAYTTVAQIDPKTLIYLCDRQLDTLKIPTILKFLEWMLISDGDIAVRTARQEVPKLRRLLDGGSPAVLGLIHAHGLSSPTNNHQVVAASYAFDDATKDLAITLYDPNHPGESPTLNLNLASPANGINLTQSTGEPVRGFFVIPYTPVASAAVGAAKAAPKALAARDAAPTTIKLNWPVDSARINQHFGEHPENYRGFGLPGHEGLDFFAVTGASVYAAADGVVYQAGFPANHPYGRHVRVRHQVDGQVFHTIYAHLSQISVQVDQTVSAGDVLGQADNTGNSFGSHLHLTLKIDGQQTPGYPAGIVDPEPYLLGGVVVKPNKPLPPPSGITVYTTIELNLRSAPNTDADIITILPTGEALSVLGDANAVRPLIGVQDQWLQVQTAGGAAGFVAAWLVQTIDQSFPPTSLVVYAFDTASLRSGPSAGFGLVASLTMNDPLTVLGDEDNARAKIGKQDQWVQVQTEAGLRGFVAAWLVHLTGQVAAPSGIQVTPLDFVNVRARPSLDANVLTVVQPGDILAVLGDKNLEASKVGQPDAWLNVSTPQKYAGYVAAWLVKLSGGGATPPVDAGLVTVFPTAGVNLRAQPSVNSPRLNGALLNEPLKVVEADPAAARAKIGVTDQWLYVEKTDGTRGWVAAWFVSAAIN